MQNGICYAFQGYPACCRHTVSRQKRLAGCLLIDAGGGHFILYKLSVAENAAKIITLKRQKHPYIQEHYVYVGCQNPCQVMHYEDKTT